MIDSMQPERARYANPPIAILGVPFDNVTAAETIAAIERMVESRQPHYLVTANVDFLVQAQEDVELRRILFDAHLVLCDGTPLFWASRLLGNPLPERVAGADLVPLLLRVAAGKKYRVFLLGATPASAKQAVDNLKKLHPDLIIADHYSPPFNKLLEMDHEEIKRRIVAAKPDLLFVSLGCPKQEKWIAMHYRSLGVPVSAGVGATIDFLAGTVKRAPVWMQRICAEWIYRLAQEPRRLLGRYTKDFWVFGRKIFAQWWRLEFRLHRDPNIQKSAPVRAEHNWQCLKLPERLDIAAVRDDSRFVDGALADGRHCLLEMSHVKFIDSTGVGLLIRLQKKVRATGRQLILLAPSHEAKRALELMQLQNFFDCMPDFGAAQHLIAAREREQNAVVRLRSPAAINPVLWQGEITAANATEVWSSTATHINSKQRRRLVIDLSGVRFMDSTGLGLMVRAKKLAQLKQVKLEFTHPQPAVQNVIHLARLEEFLMPAASPAVFAN
ncbi:MAG TPA: WecB/TagA/CpsF family glycosyltransferase [Candidatus Polarisedimenticolia bacterium]|nr:WecB/TagA/CpsF family glycosyltransferase [Candidatus Polarisedimenticolia bacterium]